MGLNEEMPGGRSLPKLDLTDPLVIALVAGLRSLDALPISTAKEREVWSAAAREFGRKLRTDWSGIYDSLPHELEHYLVDDDIRARDEGYARYQRVILAELLTLSPEQPSQSTQPTHEKGG